MSSPGSYSETYLFDSVGRASQSSIVADGTTYQLNQAYNSSTGFLETLTYPTSTSGVRLKVKYSYQNGHLNKIHDYTGDVQTTKYWEAISTNARGMVIDEEFGNGLKTFSKYDHIAGWLDYRQSAPGGGSATQYLNYAWDKVGNLTQRKDENQVITENFVYDSLNRLDYTTGVSSLDLTYDAIGNITYKNDVGSYTYHATKKHAVTAAGGSTYAYDANGNQNSRNGASIAWTSYNLPSLINQSGGNSSSFAYGAGRQRYKQVNVNGATTETTIYVAGVLERVTAGTVTDWKHYVAGGTGVAAMVIRSSSGTNTIYYPLKDHLGSTDRITSSSGSVVVALSYDAFGKRRGSNWTGSPSSGDWSNIAASTRHGFTSHEHLDNLTLVHMNGRVQDPVLGRFISADPFVPEPFKGESFNRFSYVHNNPLSFRDPSGFSEESLPFLCWNCGFLRGHSAQPPHHWNPRTEIGNRANFYPHPEGFHRNQPGAPPGNGFDPNRQAGGCVPNATQGINPSGGVACNLPPVQVQIIGLCEDGSGELCDLTASEGSSSDINFAELGRAVGQRWDLYWGKEFSGDVSIALTVTSGTVAIRATSAWLSRLSQAQLRSGVRVIVLTAARILKDPGSRVPQPPRPPVPEPPGVTQPYVPPGSVPPNTGGS